MKKTLLSLVIASAILPGISNASSFQDLATINFTANSTVAKFQLFWEDLVSTNALKGWTNETDGKYSLTLTNSLTNQVLFNKANLGSVVTGDVSGVTSGSFLQDFVDLSKGSSYTLSFIGKWNGPNGINWDNSTPSVSVSAVPEPETFAMFLAGLGIIGAIVRRRKKSDLICYR